MNLPRPTQKDIARKAGVSQVTVSAALRNRPDISAATREKVLQIATELGYRPDPALATLIHHRNQQRQTTFHGTLAYVTRKPHRPHTMPHHSDRLAFDGFCRGAEAAGYSVEIFNLLEEPLSPERLTKILISRGIRGIVIPKIDELDQIPQLDWEWFSVVELGHGMPQQIYHRVSTDQFHSTRETLRNAARLGYSRPGLVMTEGNLRSVESWPEGIWPIACRQWGLEVSVPVFSPDAHGDHALKQALGWLETYQPDCLVSNLPIPALIQDSWNTPLARMPFACVNRKPNQENFAGINERLDLVGSKAAELLIAQVRQNKHGSPEFPALTVVRGSWVNGPSLPAKS